ncbi:MAG: 4-alpha-glucanotransferase [Bacteroides sp.]|nr:4-alpha-glucanotransferase [Eubacterium sp.]MCM1418431.1 4-alpha-glucanotransferase [Roseburia sp.]MCM1461548.1 4-alpha-glucanotransferase [Bacteroides sp.]
MERSCGVLMHITSLPSPYGIGSLGAEAERFLGWLKRAGQKYWQVLPIGPTGYGDSPYQSFSTFAGNPLLIDLDALAEKGLIPREALSAADFGGDPTVVDYEKVAKAKKLLLRAAFEKFRPDETDGAYEKFIEREAFWLDDYALFMAIKEENGLVSWTEWSDPLRKREPSALAAARERLKQEIDHQKFLQFIFYGQWEKLKSAANRDGIKIIGDIPIYVSPDSADVWAEPRLFQTDEDLFPKAVAGVPPDYFSATGQLWGNPLYDWDEMKKDGYAWWGRRLEKASSLYDVVRIDHFRAFDTYWAVPYGEKTAVNGEWRNGPGMDLWSVLKEKYPDVAIIAEDLGDIFDSVKELLKASGFPGMRVLQFGFNPEFSENDHLPHRYPENAVVYTGTHDNSTVLGWFKAADPRARAMAKRYLKPRLFEKTHKTFIRALYASAAALAIVPLQDILGLDDRARMNVPSTLGGNWGWRAKPGQITDQAADYLKDLSETYYR